MPPIAERRFPATFTPQQQEELFEEILRLYDLADNIMDTISKPDNTHQEVLLELSKPFLTQITNSANIISAFYTEVARVGRPITKELQDTFETAFRNVFYAYKDLLDGIENQFLPRGKIS